MDANHEYRRLVCCCCGMTKDVPVYCGDRFCDICSGPRRAKLFTRLTALLKTVTKERGFKWRFITLTIPTAVSPLESFTTLTASFRKLRQRQFWRHNVRGGVAVYEITRSNGKWHLHAHVIAYSRYLPQHQLAKLWTIVSPGRIVDVRLLPETTAIRYAVKYATKQALPDCDRSDASHALSQSRMYTSFGILHGQKVTLFDRPAVCNWCGKSDWKLLSQVCADPGTVVTDFAELSALSARAAPVRN